MEGKAKGVPQGEEVGARVDVEDDVVRGLSCEEGKEVQVWRVGGGREGGAGELRMPLFWGRRGGWWRGRCVGWGVFLWLVIVGL